MTLSVEGLANHAARLAPRQNGQAGSAQNQSSSGSQLVSTLVPVLLVSLGFFVAFLFLRRLFPRIYQPRTFLSSLRPQERAKPLPNGLFNWVATFMSTPDTHVLNTSSLDGFLFLRLLKISVVTCIVGCLICMPVLFPVNATGPGGKMQLDIISFSNATSSDNKTSYFRWFAHAGCSWLFFGFIIYMITRESLYYINLRQAYLVSPLYANRVSSKTVLFTAVPDAYLDEGILREMLGPEVVRIWIPRDTSDLEEQVQERDKIALRLEGAETKLVKTANANHLKTLKKKKGASSEGQPSGSDPLSWVPTKQRPTHRLKPLIGKKVDTIDWCREELFRRIPDVEKHQNSHRDGKTKPVHSVFVQFTSLREAQAAFQSLTHHQPLHMSPRYTGIHPDEIIWSNLNISWWARVIRGMIAIALVTITVIFWTIPVAAIGAISNITSLTNLSPATQWLSFLNGLPSVLSGVVDGLLPTILLAVLMALLPIFLRYMAKVAGSATTAEVEYRTQNYYFAFQVIQVFLINTLASGVIKSLSYIGKQPAQAPAYLASNLPTASNFYLAYFILQGLGSVSGTLVAVVGLILFVILSKILDTTPRKSLTRWISLATPGLGTVYPIYTNLFVIAICYAVLQPLVLAFAAIGLYLFYFAYRYEFLYVYSSKSDTKGLMYPRALQHLFVGLYFAEVCLLGLFAIGMGSSPTGAVGPLIMSILMLIFTALYHVSLNSALDPLLKYLPKTLETEERRLLAMEEADVEADEAVGNGSNTQHDGKVAHGKTTATGVKNSTNYSPPPMRKKPNMITKFLRPDIYTDYYTMRRLVPRNFATIEYDERTESDAYHHPSVVSEPPLLWIPRDELGVSAHEIRATPNAIQITDEGARLDEKNNIVWDNTNAMSTPIYQEKVYY